MTNHAELDILPIAERAGLAAVGIARCTPAETHSIYTSWLASGYAADMTYLHTRAPQRADPRHIAPATQSIIAAALRYPRNPAPGTGFSSYAWGRDYHTVMKDKLRPLADFLHAHCHAKVTRICVDSAPLLEREWAVKAGIGWRGRQGQIVNQKLGCCLVLGFILTDARLTPSTPVVNRCGRCRRCLDACPTGALQPNGQVDAHRCTAYLTIEHREALSPEQQQSIGTALFGCDACTAVCPWNRFGEDQVCPELTSHRRPTATECTQMDQATFDSMFGDTSVARTTLPRLQRNAAIAIANQRRSTACRAQEPRPDNAISRASW